MQPNSPVNIGPGMEYALYILTLKDTDLRRAIFQLDNFGTADEVSTLDSTVVEMVVKYFGDVYEAGGDERASGEALGRAVLDDVRYRRLLQGVWKNPAAVWSLQAIFQPTGLYTGSGAHPDVFMAYQLVKALNA